MSSLKVSSINLNSSENTKISIATNDLDIVFTANATEQLRIGSNGIFGSQIGFTNMQTFTTPGSTTWTIPERVQKFKVTLVGGGGGGGSAAFNAPLYNGHGGGAGGAAIIYYNYVFGQNIVSLNIGLGGRMTGVANSNGINGFASNINYNGVWVFANGGFGGANNNQTLGITSLPADGGDASGGTLNLKGGRGILGTVGTANGAGGYGGASPLGFGEITPSGLTASNGINAIGYGSGGSGSRAGGVGTNALTWGGEGANGIIIIEY